MSTDDGHNVYFSGEEGKHQKRTFWLYKGIVMLKLGRMQRQTGEKFVDPTAMSR